MRRISLAVGLVLIFILAGAPIGAARATLEFQHVVEEARKLAEQEFKQPEGQVPEFLLRLTYDQWRDIRFDPERSLWQKDNLFFAVQFFHPGVCYNHPVKIYVVDSTGVQEIPFSRDLFDYGASNFKEEVPPDLGFAGFRLHCPINTEDYRDEVLVFLGASYFRAVARGQSYGLSARGLAIDTALPSGEEFPYFKKFWLLRPARQAREMIIYGLLDSPSLSGAYRFVVRPGEETILDVRSTLFRRRNVEKLGVAPLTSMFFYGENTNQKPVEDFRPEVHDSDGLLIAMGSGEWVWRPLMNPPLLQINAFEAGRLVGFGLMQRDREFDHYQDLEACYESRPSVWITPRSDWRNGHIELVQIPTGNEINDNIVAFWVPGDLKPRGEPLSFSYTMSWQPSDRKRPSGGRVVATRTATGKDGNVRKFVIDFAGEVIESLPADEPLTAVVTIDPRTRLVEQQLHKNRVTGGWRLVFQVMVEKSGSMDRVLPQKEPALEFRSFLKLGERAMTETWSYALPF